MKITADARPPGREDSPERGGKPYRAPRLLCYGDVRELTQNIAGNRGNDGNAFPPLSFTFDTG